MSNVPGMVAFIAAVASKSTTADSYSCGSGGDVTLRRLAKTSGGRLTLVPGDAGLGGIVSLVQGIRTLLVLRRRDKAGSTAAEASVSNKFELVGEAFVHGIMDGSV